MSDGTPILGNGPTQPPEPPGSSDFVAHPNTHELIISGSTAGEDFSSYDVLLGLHGVCDALNALEWHRNMNLDCGERLARAARVLVAILLHREAES